MKIILVGPNHEENFSIRYLSASLLSGGHSTILGSLNSPVDTVAVVNAAQEAGLVGQAMPPRMRDGAPSSPCASTRVRICSL